MLHELRDLVNGTDEVKAALKQWRDQQDMQTENKTTYLGQVDFNFGSFAFLAQLIENFRVFEHGVVLAEDHAELQDVLIALA